MTAATTPSQPLLVPESARPAVQTRSAPNAASRTGKPVVRDWTSHIRMMMAGRRMLANNAGSSPENEAARVRKITGLWRYSMLPMAAVAAADSAYNQSATRITPGSLAAIVATSTLMANSCARGSQAAKAVPGVDGPQARSQGPADEEPSHERNQVRSEGVRLADQVAHEEGQSGDPSDGSGWAGWQGEVEGNGRAVRVEEQDRSHYRNRKCPDREKDDEQEPKGIHRGCDRRRGHGRHQRCDDEGDDRWLPRNGSTDHLRTHRWAWPRRTGNPVASSGQQVILDRTQPSDPLDRASRHHAPRPGAHGAERSGCLSVLRACVSVADSPPYAP